MRQEKGESWYKQPHARRLPKANAAERRLCKEIAHAKAEDSRNGRVQEATRRWLSQGTICEKGKAKAGNRRPCARGVA